MPVIPVAVQQFNIDIIDGLLHRFITSSFFFNSKMATNIDVIIKINLQINVVTVLFNNTGYNQLMFWEEVVRKDDEVPRFQKPVAPREACYQSDHIPRHVPGRRINCHVCCFPAKQENKTKWTCSSLVCCRSNGTQLNSVVN